MNKFTQFFDRKLLFILVAALIILQLCLMIVYQVNNRQEEQEDLKELLVEKNMLFIQRFQSASQEAQQEMIKKPHVPNSNITLTSIPKWNTQIGSSSLWKIYTILNSQTGMIRLSISIADKEWLNIEIKPSPVSAFLDYFMIVGELIIALFLIIFLWLTYRHSIPLRTIADAAKRLSSDMKTKPLKLKGSAIVRYTFQTINEMQVKINNLIKERTFMLAAISHDLRTPLTSMKLRSELIEDSLQRQKNQNDIAEMEAMIAQILAFTETECSQDEKTEIDLVSLLVAICHDFSDRGHNVKYLGNDEERIVFTGSSLALKRAFANLIDNAVKYGSSAEVNLTKTKNIALTVRDFGSGIAEQYMDKIFTPFYRTDQARSRKKIGTGLGLLITRNIVHAHQGQMSFNRLQPIGFEVKIVFNC